MEDVSMGLWVEQFNASMQPVEYSHSWKFCQYGCTLNYYTAHYQSPSQMMCLWDNLLKGRPQCCNFRWPKHSTSRKILQDYRFGTTLTHFVIFPLWC